MTKFRLSNHSLMIEKGRHLHINKNERFCKFCPNNIEDEIHFLIICKAFKTHRKELFQIAYTHNKQFYTFDNKSQFTVLLNTPGVIKSTAKYLYRTLEIRDFLIKDPKNTM